VSIRSRPAAANEAHRLSQAPSYMSCAGSATVREASRGGLWLRSLHWASQLQQRHNNLQPFFHGGQKAAGEVVDESTWADKSSSFSATQRRTVHPGRSLQAWYSNISADGSQSAREVGSGGDVYGDFLQQWSKRRAWPDGWEGAPNTAAELAAHIAQADLIRSELTRWVRSHEERLVGYSLPKRPKLSAEAELAAQRALRPIFDLLDRNGSGSVSATELQDMLLYLDIHLPRSDVIEMIDAVHKEGVSTGSESSSSDPQMDFGTFVRLMEHDASYHANPHHHHRSHKPSERAQGSEYLLTNFPVLTRTYGLRQHIIKAVGNTSQHRGHRHVGKQLVLPSISRESSSIASKMRMQHVGGVATPRSSHGHPVATL